MNEKTQYYVVLIISEVQTMRKQLKGKKELGIKKRYNPKNDLER